MKVIATKVTPRPKGDGFLYRGVTTIMQLGKLTGKLVQNETYIIPHYVNDDDIGVTLKTPTKTVKIDDVTREQYRQIIKMGRTGYRDTDPYL